MINSCRHLTVGTCFECQLKDPVVPVSDDGTVKHIKFRYRSEGHEAPTIIGGVIDDIKTEHERVIEWPPHYNKGTIQMTDYVIDQNLDWCSGNVVKYVVRAPHKGKELEDLKKAKWYLERRIREVESR